MYTKKDINRLLIGWLIVDQCFLLLAIARIRCILVMVHFPCHISICCKYVRHVYWDLLNTLCITFSSFFRLELFPSHTVHTHTHTVCWCGAIINAVDDGIDGGGGDVVVIVIAFRTWKCIINIVCDLVSSCWLALSVFSE